MMRSNMQKLTVTVEDEEYEKLQHMVDTKDAESISHAVRIAIRKLPNVEPIRTR